jgi:hypothetical protein
MERIRGHLELAVKKATSNCNHRAARVVTREAVNALVRVDVAPSKATVPADGYCRGVLFALNSWARRDSPSQFL